MKGLQEFNKVFVLGNLTREVESKITTGGMSIANFTVAVNRSYKSNDEWQQEVAFIDITAFGKQAENCSNYLEKGQKVLVEGRIKQESWTSKEGLKRSKLLIVAEKVSFLGKVEKAEAVSESASEEENKSFAEDVPF
jgi:single-strand DNA-binding protein